VEQAVKLVDGQLGSVHADEAARGRVSYVRVKNWGSGRQDDIGDLQVESTSEAAAMDAPFYEQLARRLQMMEAEGELAVVRPPGAPPLPPVEAWAFAESHYVQHMVDLLCVHTALEQGISRALAALQQEDASQDRARLAEVVGLLGFDHGLARSAHIAADLAIICADPARVPSPLPNAAAFAQYIRLAAERCERAEEGEELTSAAARLMASAYVVHLTLLTSGMRIGAAATERLGLFAKQAVHTYRTYPDEVGRPLEAFVTAVNAAGDALEQRGREAFVVALPGAMQRASLLLEALARTA